MLVQLKKSLGGIQHCVTVLGKCIFDSNNPFAIPLTHDDLDYCFTNNNKTKEMNGYKKLLKAIRFSPIFKNRCFVQK